MGRILNSAGRGQGNAGSIEHVGAAEPVKRRRRARAQPRGPARDRSATIYMLGHPQEPCVHVAGRDRTATTELSEAEPVTSRSTSGQHHHQPVLSLNHGRAAKLRPQLESVLSSSSAACAISARAGRDFSFTSIGPRFRLDNASRANPSVRRQFPNDYDHGARAGRAPVQKSDAVLEVMQLPAPGPPCAPACCRALRDELYDRRAQSLSPVRRTDAWRHHRCRAFWPGRACLSLGRLTIALLWIYRSRAEAPRPASGRARAQHGDGAERRRS